MGTEADDDVMSGLGAPMHPERWQHGQAGSVGANQRIDCWLKVSNGRIEQARFEVFASAHALSAARLLAQWLIGRRCDEVVALDGLAIARMASMADEARSEALCLEDAVHAAINAKPMDERQVE
jgi:NifU-like protein involved in Fe-S cluster formation